MRRLYSHLNILPVYHYPTHFSITIKSKYTGSLIRPRVRPRLDGFYGWMARIVGDTVYPISKVHNNPIPKVPNTQQPRYTTHKVHHNPIPKVTMNPIPKVPMNPTTKVPDNQDTQHPTTKVPNTQGTQYPRYTTTKVHNNPIPQVHIKSTYQHYDIVS